MTSITDACMVRAFCLACALWALGTLPLTARALKPLNVGGGLNNALLRGQLLSWDPEDDDPAAVPTEAPAAAAWTQARLAEQLSNNTGMGETGGEKNFCDRSKLVPTFYLLGAPKCATTSFSMELGRFGNVREAPHLWSPKEWHFWESFPTGTDANYARETFFKKLGDCPKTNRLVLGDYSITNLAAVPLPDGMELTPCSCKAATQKKGKHGGDVPRLLHHVYQDRIRDVTLMVMIREPLSRMQSAWHHAKVERFANYWGFQDCCLESFGSAVRTVVDAAKDGQWATKIGGTGNVWQSLYGRQLEAYLKYFSASQLIVMPYKQYTKGSRSQWVDLCKDLESRLDTTMNCSAPSSFEENVHPHPPLEQEIDENLRAEFDALMAPEKDILLKVLAKAHTNGANLVGYKGDKGASDGITAWLEEFW